MEGVLRIELENESIVLGKPAKVRVFLGGELKAEIVAEVGPQKGADGGDYPGVTLNQV